MMNGLPHVYYKKNSVDLETKMTNFMKQLLNR